MSNTLYDLVSINGYAIPNVQKGTLTVAPNPKYNQYENEAGGKVIEIIAEGPLKGSVHYSGLFQSEISALMEHVALVSTMTVYSPYSGSTRTFKALINVGDSNKIIYDAVANAWSLAFDFEEIGAVET